MTPLVTCVLLCTWPRRAAMVGDALASYDAQTHAARELVVVNDGAPLASARADVTVVNVAPATTGAKRNVGAAAARGEWIAAWDDDDVSLADRLAELLACAVGAAAATCRYVAYADRDLRLLGVVSGENYGTSIVRRDAWERVGGCPDLAAREDVELFGRLLVRGYRVARSSRLLYAYRRHDANVSAFAGVESLGKLASRRVPDLDILLGPTQRAVDSILAAPRDTLLVEV